METVTGMETDTRNTESCCFARRMRKPLLPPVKGGLADSQLATDIARRCTALGLAQGIRGLLVGESFGPVLSSRPKTP
jgi:hypothetical protein